MCTNQKCQLCERYDQNDTINKLEMAAGCEKVPNKEGWKDLEKLREDEGHVRDQASYFYRHIEFVSRRKNLEVKGRRISAYNKKSF